LKKLEYSPAGQDSNIWKFEISNFLKNIS